MKIVARVTAVAASVVLVMGVAPADASSQADVKVSKIAKVKLKGKSKAKVVPKVSARSGVKVVSKTLTVRKNGKVVAKNKKSVSLRAGTYRVTTKVKYKVPLISQGLVYSSTLKRFAVPLPMSCIITGSELTGYRESKDITVVLLDCTGEFDGVFKARMAYYPDGLQPLKNLWGDGFERLPSPVPTAVGSRFGAVVDPLQAELFRTYRDLSSTRTKEITQTLKVVR